MNRLTRAAVILAAGALVLPPSVKAQFNFTTNNGKITITKYTGSGGSVVIPPSTNGYPIATIGAYAFEYCTRLTSVDIGTNVTSIGAWAFASCQGLTNANIANSVTTIDSFAFYFCTRLSNAAIPTNVTSIGSSAFEASALTSVTIPKSVANIGDSAFACTRLTNIVVDPSNSFYAGVGGVLFIKDQTTLIQCPGGKTGPYTIPSSVTNIGDYAFTKCYFMTSVTIPTNVTSIGHRAFLGCGLTSVAIPNSITNIGYAAFCSCTSLTNIMVDALNSFYASMDGALFNKNQTTLIQYPGGKAGSYTIPNSVSSIGNMAFADCYLMTSTIIPNSVTAIGLGAFGYCLSLTNVTIGSGVTYIDSYAFEYCNSLTALCFQGDAPSLGNYVFSGDLATVYYLPGTSGWDATYGDLPTVPWYLPNPLILATTPNFGVRTNQFGFIISWATNLSVVVERCTDLIIPDWSAVSTNALVNGCFYFSDAKWTNYPTRFYRIHSP